MKIGILGSGLMGAKLGQLWARCGHDVTFAYSRSRSKLVTAAMRRAVWTRLSSAAWSGNDRLLAASATT